VSRGRGVRGQNEGEASAATERAVRGDQSGVVRVNTDALGRGRNHSTTAHQQRATPSHQHPPRQASRVRAAQPRTRAQRPARRRRGRTGQVRRVDTAGLPALLHLRAAAGQHRRGLVLARRNKEAASPAHPGQAARAAATLRAWGVWGRGVAGRLGQAPESSRRVYWLVARRGRHRPSVVVRIGIMNCKFGGAGPLDPLRTKAWCVAPKA
jgi:ABC-type transporter Mla MlaB component